MENSVLSKLHNRLIAATAPDKRYPVIYDANAANASHFSKRALLIYVVKPFLTKDDDADFSGHQSRKQCKQIATILGEFGDTASSRLTCAADPDGGVY
jgi:hypothetical protein